MNLDSVKELAKNDLPQDKLKTVNHYLSLVTPERDLLSVDKVKVGDTYFHKVVGGKNRPWVVLWVRKGWVGAATLTHHTEIEGGIPCECRFWEGSSIGPCLDMRPVEAIKDSIYYPYTNLKHLKEVRETFFKIWS